MSSTHFYAENNRYFAPFGPKSPKKQSFPAVFCRRFPFEVILQSVANVLLTFSLFGPFWVRFGSREKFKSHRKNNTFWPASYTESDKNVQILQEIQHFLHFRWPACTAWWPFGTAKTIHFCRRWPFLRLEKSKYCKKYNIFLKFGGLPYLPDDHLAQQKQCIFVGHCPSWDSKSQSIARNTSFFDFWGFPHLSLIHIWRLPTKA